MDLLVIVLKKASITGVVFVFLSFKNIFDIALFFFGNNSFFASWLTHNCKFFHSANKDDLSKGGHYQTHVFLNDGEIPFLKDSMFLSKGGHYQTQRISHRW